MLHGIQGPAALWVPSVPMIINRKHTEAAREDASNETAETLRIGKQRQMHSVLWRRCSAAPLFFPLHCKTTRWTVWRVPVL